MQTMTPCRQPALSLDSRALTCKAVFTSTSTHGAGVVLLAVAFVKLNTAIIVQKKGEEYVVADGHAVALNYVRSGAVLTDLLTIVPTIVQVGGYSKSSQLCPCHAAHGVCATTSVRILPSHTVCMERPQHRHCCRKCSSHAETRMMFARGCHDCFAGDLHGGGQLWRLLCNSCAQCHRAVAERATSCAPP